jgi:hypothetical protein
MSGSKLNSCTASYNDLYGLSEDDPILDIGDI